MAQDWYHDSSYPNYSYHDYPFYHDYLDHNTSEADGDGCSGAEVSLGMGAGFGVLRAALYCAVLLVGLPGNAALLGALWSRGAATGTGAVRRRRRCWRTSEILAANLALSDLLFLGALPLWIHSEANAGEWGAGETACKLAPYITALTMYVGVLLLTVMSIDRYVAVVHAGVYRRVRKQALVVCSCVACWLGSAVLALPVPWVRELRLQREEGPAYCGERDWRALAYPASLSLILLLLTFFLPMLLIVSCYCSLAQALGRHARGGAVAPGSPASLQRTVRMVLLVAGAFLICWLPFNTCKLLGAVERCLNLPQAPPSWRCTLRQAATMGMHWTAPLGFAHSCVNPLVYIAADRSLRHAVLQGAPCQRICHGREGGAWGGASSQTTPTSWGEGGGEREGRERGKEASLRKSE